MAPESGEFVRVNLKSKCTAYVDRAQCWFQNVEYVFHRSVHNMLGLQLPLAFHVGILISEVEIGV